MNKVRVTVCGKDFYIRTDESQEYIDSLGVQTENEINKLMAVSPTFTTQNAAILTALIALDTAHKADQSVMNVRASIKEYVDEAGIARDEKEAYAAKARNIEAEYAALKKQYDALKKEMERMKKEAIVPGDQLVLENTVTPAVTVLASEPEKADGKKKSTKQESVSSASAAGGKAVRSDVGTAGEGSSEKDGSSPYADDISESLENYQLPGQISLLDMDVTEETSAAASEKTDAAAEAAPRKGRRKKK